MSDEDVTTYQDIALPRLSRGDATRSNLAELVRTISNADARSRYDEEAAGRRIRGDSQPNSCSSSFDGENTIISWDENDPENPYNWSTKRKTSILLITMMLIINSTMGSSLPSMAVPFIAREWSITEQTQRVLSMSTYLIGYVVGPVTWGPLSEHFGRRNLVWSTFALYCVWTMACALAPNYTALLIFRLLSGVCASAPIAIVAGILADIYDDPVIRGRAMGWFMATTLFGPLFAPIISGFCSPTIGWRWTFWIGLLYAAASWVALAFLPETYAPKLLSQRAEKMRKKDPKAHIFAASELEPRDMKQLMTVVLTRPFRMICFELIVTCACLFLALCYAIFYMSFGAYPIIFQQLYGLSPGVAGLCFLPIGVGALLALPIWFWYDSYFSRAKAQNASWARKEEARRLPVGCLGGPLFVVSLFWLGWTARSEVPFVVPMLAGLPFGLGFELIFMSLLNYLTDAYEIFAASANAASSTCRSLFAVVLPLATTPMFTKLGIAGACSLLGGLSALMSIIPFVFIWQGERIRAGSKFCIALRERKEEMERKAEQQRQRRANRQVQAGGLVEKAQQEVV